MENILEYHLMDFQTMAGGGNKEKQDGADLNFCSLLRHMRDEEVYNNTFLNERNTEFSRFRKVADALMRSLIDKGRV